MKTQVTRTQIAIHLEKAFDARSSATKEHILATAQASGASPQELTVLALLPDRHYAGLRDLWPLLPVLPVD